MVCTLVIAGIRVPDAVRHPSCRSAEPGPRLSKLGPGSAAHRFAKSYALRCVRGTQISTFLLHILDAGKHDAFGTLFGIAEIELVLRQKYRVAVDIVGDAGA